LDFFSKIEPSTQPPSSNRAQTKSNFGVWKSTFPSLEKKN
jgi:hypothetical protein